MGVPSLKTLIVSLIMVSALPCAHADRDTPLPYGFLLASAEAQPVATDRPTVNSEAMVALSRARESISALEAARGPYHPGLAQPLLAAAALAREMRFDEAAIELYSWALQNLRINRGLATPEQLPVVEALLELHREAGDSEAVNNREAYIYRLAGRGQRPWSEDRLRAALRYLAWWQEWLLLKGEWYDGRELWDLHRAGEALAESVCAAEAWAQEWCGPMTLRALGTLYLIDYQIEPIDDFGDPRRLRRRPDWDQDMFDQRLYDLAASAYAAGVRLLQTALERVPDDPDLKLALADWRWFQGRQSSAREDYRALQAEMPARFVEPEPLPTLPVFRRDPRLARDSDRVILRVKVTARGQAREVEFTGPETVEEGVRIRARRALRDTRFRPRLNANGEPEDAEVTLSLLALR